MNEKQQPEPVKAATRNQDGDVIIQTISQTQAAQTEAERRKALRTPPPKKRGPSVTIAPGAPASPDVFDTPPTRL
jgi:hypothetical protein